MRTHTQCIWWGPLSNNDIVYNILTCKAIILFWQQQQQKKHKNCEMTKLKDYDYDMRIVQSLKAMVDAHTKNQEIKFNMHINKIRIPHLNGDGKEKYLYTVSEEDEGIEMLFVWMIFLMYVINVCARNGFAFIIHYRI